MCAPTRSAVRCPSTAARGRNRTRPRGRARAPRRAAARCRSATRSRRRRCGADPHRRPRRGESRRAVRVGVLPRAGRGQRRDRERTVARRIADRHRGRALGRGQFGAVRHIGRAGRVRLRGGRREPAAECWREALATRRSWARRWRRRSGSGARLCEGPPRRGAVGPGGAVAEPVRAAYSHPWRSRYGPTYGRWRARVVRLLGHADGRHRLPDLLGGGSPAPAPTITGDPHSWGNAKGTVSADWGNDGRAGNDNSATHTAISLVRRCAEIIRREE